MLAFDRFLGCCKVCGQNIQCMQMGLIDKRMTFLIPHCLQGLSGIEAMFDGYRMLITDLLYVSLSLSISLDIMSPFFLACVPVDVSLSPF